MANKPTDLIEAHEAMASVLDAKFPHLKEWTAFRAINRALLAWLDGNAPAAAAPSPAPAARPRRVIQRKRKNAPTPYMTLANNALSVSANRFPRRK